MSENSNWQNRFEDKLDALRDEIQASNKLTAEQFKLESNRTTKLETQGGMVKWGMTFLIPILGWIIARIWPT